MAPTAPGVARITARELNRATLARQGLLEPIARGTAGAAVERIGSLQAQHPEWPPVALAARAADREVADLAGALERREVVRSSLMRITIHVVSAADLWPMFTVMQPLRAGQWRALTRADPVESAIGKRLLAAHAEVRAALAKAPMSSLAIDRMLHAAVGEIPTRAARVHWRHFAAVEPLVHVPHAGEGYGRSLYALASEWLDVERPELDPADARRHVARRYLAAFGPASVDDLAGYVGRGKGGIGPWKQTIAALDGEIVTFTDEIGRTLYDLDGAPRPGVDVDAPPRLLARWDSLLLSHASKHRDRVIGEAARPAVFTKNADVLPTLLIDGVVAGTWKVTRANGSAHIAVRPFRTVPPTTRRAVLDEAERVLAILAPDAARRVEIVG